MKNRQELGLYIHIPFCRRKCLYCDFTSFAGMSCREIEAYAEAVLRELRFRAPSADGYAVDTVYFGGGTPTLVPPETLCGIIRCIKENYRLLPDAEISAECNPGTVTPDSLSRLRDGGVTRLSIGLQSFCDEELRLLGRIHTAREGKEAFLAARKAGFDNVSADLMFGIPGQTRDSFRKTLEQVCELGPDHLSAYGLILEPGTPFGDGQDLLDLPDEDEERSMYMDAIRILAHAGLSQYEISNFAKPGRRCAHNMKYWNMDPYLGFGLSAHSYFCGTRFCHGKDMAEYLADPEAVCEDEKPDGPDAAREYLMMRLRLCDGVEKKTFEERTGMSFGPYEKRMKPYVSSGHMAKDKDRYALTPEGFYVSNTILTDILYGE
ncbi:MAG: radical SAM family heme chaperone HemW [Clostridia bacterium]|nr:radical SAM family heme chaperone HemW [Clostridia bacterium]